MQTVIRTDYSDFTVKWARWVLKILKWECVGQRPACKQAVITTYPHVANMDLFYALMSAFALRIPVVYMMKKEWFFWPLGPIFKWLGGIPIDRSKSNNVVDQMIKWFEAHETLYVICPPEGTRKNVQYWKMGFYFIAVGAKVPVLPAFCDYYKRRSGVVEPIEMTGDLAVDFEKIKAAYMKEVGRCGEIHPKYFQKNKGGTETAQA